LIVNELKIVFYIGGRRTFDAKVDSQEGNSPEYRLRFLKHKNFEVDDLLTSKSSASDQQYFKKSVTA